MRGLPAAAHAGGLPTGSGHVESTVGEFAFYDWSLAGGIFSTNSNPTHNAPALCTATCAYNFTNSFPAFGIPGTLNPGNYMWRARFAFTGPTVEATAVCPVSCAPGAFRNFYATNWENVPITMTAQVDVVSTSDFAVILHFDIAGSGTARAETRFYAQDPGPWNYSLLRYDFTYDVVPEPRAIFRYSSASSSLALRQRAGGPAGLRRHVGANMSTAGLAGDEPTLTLCPMAPRPWMIAETNWKHVANCRYEVAVLPWGATEAHNHHLPYGTDNYQNEHIVAEAGRLAWELGAKVGILPSIPFGVQTGQHDIPFCINLNPSTQHVILSDVIASLARVGVPKFVLLNGHGGNDFRQMLRELQLAHPTVFLSTVNWYGIDSGATTFDIVGDHADERETSMMLHLHPDLVLPKDEWGDGRTYPSRLRAIREKWAWAQRDWRKATLDTGVGDPRHSTAAKGAAYLDTLTRQFASYLVELAAVDPADLYQRPAGE